MKHLRKQVITTYTTQDVSRPSRLGSAGARGAWAAALPAADAAPDLRGDFALPPTGAAAVHGLRRAFEDGSKMLGEWKLYLLVIINKLKIGDFHSNLKYPEGKVPLRNLKC